MSYRHLSHSSALAFALLSSLSITAQTNDGLSTDPIQLPTGFAITPAAAPGSVFQSLNPNLADFPDFVAGQPVTTALSPDGTRLLIVTSGYNLNNDKTGKVMPPDSNEYVFVFDTTVYPPKQIQSLTVPNTFSGLAWSPQGNEFYVSGGVDDRVCVFVRSGSGYAQAASIALGHKLGIGLLSNAPAPLNSAAPPPMAAGIGVSQSGMLAVVANLFNDSVSVVDLKARVKAAELDLRPGVIDPAKTGLPGGEYPLWVAVLGDGKAYVSSPRDREVVVLQLGLNPLGITPTVSSRIPISGQPNRMILNRAQNLLYVAVDNSDIVAVIDTSADKVIATIPVTAPRQILSGEDLPKGANPNSLALSPDEKTLYVTEGGTNAVAVLSVKPDGTGQVTGLIPTGWYPNSVSVSANGKTLYVVNHKTLPGPNTGNCRGDVQAPNVPDCPSTANQYILQLEKGGLLSLPLPNATELAALTRQVASNNRLQAVGRASAGNYVMRQLSDHIQHVIYIIKENRTYDQVLGDLEVGNGDPSITEFPEALTPNHHAFARNFVTLDNFLDSGEVSGVGWNWSTAGRTTDYAEKAQSPNYANRGLTYDWEGTNRNINVGLATVADRVKANLLVAPGVAPDPNLLPGAIDVVAPDGAGGEIGAGYIWDEALRQGLTVRNYGFYLDLVRYQGPASLNPAYIPISKTPAADGVQQAFPAKPSLLNLTDIYFRGFDQANADFYNYQEWAREFDQYVANNNLPALSLVRMPHDHFGSFSTALYGLNTPGLQIADNDYAIGLLAQKVANSPFKSNTLIFVLEDDAQDGPDHVDAHRSIAFVVGPYVKQQAVVSHRYTTVNVVRTIEAVLGLTPSSLNSAAAAPMTDVFDLTQGNWSYTALVPAILRTSKLPLPAATSANTVRPANRRLAYAKDKHSAAYWQRALGDMDYSEEDKIDTVRFNRELWKGMMGNKPYPTVRDGKDLREHRDKLLKAYGIE